MGRYVDVDLVFDGPPGPQGGRFIEAEAPNGVGVSFGTWLEDAAHEGWWRLRIPVLLAAVTRRDTDVAHTQRTGSPTLLAVLVRLRAAIEAGEEAGDEYGAAIEAADMALAMYSGPKEQEA